MLCLNHFAIHCTIIYTIHVPTQSDSSIRASVLALSYSSYSSPRFGTVRSTASHRDLEPIVSLWHVADAASIDVASHRGGNPSIGEASLSLGSGSQLEKLGRENDRESASNVALAGTSLAGSIASSVLPGGQRYFDYRSLY